jgi:hypothetical protein
MNRLFHLKDTYCQNIINCSDHEDTEFILLDYNSDDGLEDWARDSLSDHIDSGKVKFYRTNEPRFWVAAHAKNVAHRMATGDVLVNLDCDVLMPPRFSRYVSDLFSRDERIVMAFSSDDTNGNHGCAGMVGALRDDFYSVNGYDENINLGWGYDDMNYQFRVRMHNNLILFTPPKLCRCIPHGNEVRTANCQLKDIEITKDMSFSMCQDSAHEKDYVANKNVDWGRANLEEIRNILSA